MEYGLLVIIGFIILMIYLIGKKAAKQTVKIVNPEIIDMTTKRFKYQDEIEDASTMFNVPANRIFGHMMQESSGNPNCVGKIGERGLMQIRDIAYNDVLKKYPGTFAGIGYEKLWEPTWNIMAGTAYLSLCRDWVGGDLNLASQAYNVGIGNVLKNKNSGLVYLEKIMTYEAMV